MFVIVVPFNQSFDDVGFTYKVPHFLDCRVWQVVSVPFWSKSIFWVIVTILDTINIPEEKIKEILEIYDEKEFLTHLQTSLLMWISQFYFCLIHQSATLFFPKNLRGKIEKKKFSFKNHAPLQYVFSSQKILNQKQKNIFENIISSEKKKFFLYGVTGSGKTEIYIHLMKYYIDQGKQVLLLVPEIILTNQIFERIQKVFGKDVLVLNSTVSDAKKTLYWELIHQNNAKIIVGTRSSLFYPYQDLGIIIIDEEHDNSYLSDTSPRYDAIEVANKISDISWCKLLLWSGTPKINHLYEAMKGKYELLHLFEEYEGN